jgi:hypothetical protein
VGPQPITRPVGRRSSGSTGTARATRADNSAHHQHRWLLRAAVALAIAAMALVGAAQPASAAAASFTGNLTVSATTVRAGTPFTATQSATNLTGSQLYPITVGIRRLGFSVTASIPPRTGVCRIAGSATCSFLLLAPHETQSYTLTLVSTVPGTYQLQGWATSTSVPGGSVTTLSITVT